MHWRRQELLTSHLQEDNRQNNDRVLKGNQTWGNRIENDCEEKGKFEQCINLKWSLSVRQRHPPHCTAKGWHTINSPPGETISLPLYCPSTFILQSPSSSSGCPLSCIFGVTSFELILSLSFFAAACWRARSREAQLDASELSHCRSSESLMIPRAHMTIPSSLRLSAPEVEGSG